MSKLELKYCPRCHSTFECNVGNILLCQCNKIELDEKTQTFLKENYNDCLCTSCITEIKYNLNNTLSSEEL